MTRTANHPPLTRQEISTFEAEMEAAFECAVAKSDRHRMVCEIGDIRLGFEFAGGALIDAFRPGLVGTEIRGEGRVDVQLRVFDRTGSGVPIPAFRRPMRQLIGWRGECWSTEDSTARVFFDHGFGGPCIVDPETGSGTLAIDELQRVPSWARAAPFRSAIALLLQPHGIQLVHGAAIGRPDGVIFLTGYGGTGKSTTSLSCHLRGLTVLGDDYVALKAPNHPGALPAVHRVFSSLKVHPREARGASGAPADREKIVLFPFAERAGDADADGERDGDGDGDGAGRRTAPCIGFWDARLAEGEVSWLDPRHPDDVARIAAASTGLQIPGDEANMAALIARCAEAAPTNQQLNLGSDRDGVVDTIEAFLDGAMPTLASAPRPAWEEPHALRPISVVIPVYNGAQFIGEAMRNAQEQDYPHLEIIVVDDGSTDDLDAALRNINIPFRLLRQSNQGPAAARNAGIRAATGEWIAFQDVDDLWTPDALRRLARDLVLHPHARVVQCKCVTVKRGNPSEAWIRGSSPADLFPYKINAALYRKDVFDAIGGFDDTLRYGEDTEWFIRMKTREISIEIPDVLLYRRRHETNMTNDIEALEKGSREAWKKILMERIRMRRDP
jgi:hypothetical protein